MITVRVEWAVATYLVHELVREAYEVEIINPLLARVDAGLNEPDDDELAELGMALVADYCATHRVVRRR